MKASIAILNVLVIMSTIVSCSDSSSGCPFASIDDCYNPDPDGDWNRLEFVDIKPMSEVDIDVLGEHLIYFPDLDLSEPTIGLPTDHESAIEITNSFANFTHASEIDNVDEALDRTFSLDVSDISKLIKTVKNGEFEKIGAATAGGFGWPVITLPRRILDDADAYEQLSGVPMAQSGVLYDPYSIGNSSNIVNKIKVNVKGLHAFCLNIVTDNTYGMFNPTRIVAQSNNPDTVVEIKDELDDDGEPDIATVKYTGMQENHLAKLKITASETSQYGGGIGGLMVSDISTCCTPHCDRENECGGDDGCGDPCECTRNEVHSNLETNGETGIETGQAYYLRGIFTRQVLTARIEKGDSEPLLDMRPRNNSPEQQWVFVGNCSDDSCNGYFLNKATKGCLSKRYNVKGSAPYSGSCLGERKKWVIRPRGGDIVSGGREYFATGGIQRYTIMHDFSGRFLTAKVTRAEARLAASKTNSIPWPYVWTGFTNEKPWDQWIFEKAQPGEQVLED